jgi:hypothetical protein
MLKDFIFRLPGYDKISRRLGIEPPRDFLLNLLPKNSVGAEIGVHKGDFSAQILQIVKPRKLHLIDPWKHEDSPRYNKAWFGGMAGSQIEMDKRYESVCARFSNQIQSGQIEIHREFSENALTQFSDGYFDWVYIDGNHLYEYVKKDLELSLEKTKPGGFITGDDYGVGGWWEDGVRKAVDEFLQQKPVQLIMIRLGQFVISR